MPMPDHIEYYHREPPSVALRIFAFLLRHVLKRAKKGFEAFASGQIYQRPDSVAPPPKPDADAVALRVAHVQGRQVFTLCPARATPPGGKVVLYLHGGAYVNNFAPQHWTLLQTLVKQTGYTVVAPDYPLAPQHPHPAALALAEAVYRDLLAQVGAANVLLVGDSAGAGLALALALSLKQAGTALPAQLVLLSPWLDVALDNPEIAAVAPHDPFLSVQWLRLAGQAYAGTTPLRDYRLSPLYGDLRGLPPTSVFIGTHDLLLPDARRFKQLMAEQGQPINYFEYPQAFHVWMLLPIPEGRHARRQIIDLLTAA